MSVFGGSPYTSNSIRWWPNLEGEEYDLSSGADRHTKLVPAAYLVWTRNQARRAQFFHYARMYGGFEQATTMPLGGVDPAAQMFEPASLPYNVIRSATNTLTAKVIKNRPVPMYLPVGGDHRLHRRVRYLNRFVPGLFHHFNFWGRRHASVRDAGLFGTGQMLVQRDGRRISVENLYPWEVYVDPVDARGGDPRSLYLIRYLDKGVLQGRFPRHAEAIEVAPVLDESFYPTTDVFALTNRCTVIEAWHLPSFPGAKDGRHTICLLDETLLDEPYTRSDYPIARLVKDPAIGGYWGLGLGDELSGFQDEIMTMHERMSYAHRIVGGQIWFLPAGSQIYATDFNDDIGVVIEHTPGLQPSSVNPQPVHEQTYEYFRGLIPDAYGFSGISQMSAQSQKPAGVTAALALQTLDDIETDRFIGFERADEEFAVEVGRLMLRVVREIAETYGEFSVLSAGRGSGEEILWTRDVDLGEDSYVVQAWPTSLLPKTPAARMQRVLELGANGYFDKPQVLKYLDLPDTTQEEALMLSAREVADAQIAAMLSHDDPFSDEAFIPPTEHQDADYALQRSQAHYCKLEADAVDKGTINDPDVRKRLDNLDAYMKLAKNISDKAKAEAAALAMQAQAAANQQGAAPGPPAQAAPIQTPNQPNAPLSPAAPLAA